MSHVRLEGVTKRFGAFEAVKDLSLAVENGQFCALLGPSGCGKSTLLRMIAGLEAVSDGEIHIAGRNVTNLPPAKRSIAMVFQSYALYPHMTVRQNIAFSLDVAGVPKVKANARADEVAKMLQLETLMDRKPSQLSGGQRQRVAIGRSLVREPEVFLFDEPLSNLDAALRIQMRFEIARLHQQLGTTMIYVTHDQVEAMTLADKIVVLNQGEISQVGAPLDLYHRPANKFVASFIGSPAMNFLPARIAASGGGQELLFDGGARIPSPAGLVHHGPGEVEVGVRPEHIKVVAPDAPDAALSGTVQVIEQLGNATIVHVQTSAGPVIVQSADELRFVSGETIALALPGERTHIFSAGTNVSLERAA